MTWNLLYCHCNDEVEKVVELMKSNGLRRLPVIDEKEILEGDDDLDRRFDSLQ